MSDVALIRGTPREDGFRFWAYEKRNGRLTARWRSPEAYERAVARTAAASKAWRKRLSADRKARREAHHLAKFSHALERLSISEGCLAFKRHDQSAGAAFDRLLWVARQLSKQAG